MAFFIEVKNIKCGGCANTIRRCALAVQGVGGVEVDVARGIVHVEADDSVRPILAEALRQAGYPEAGAAKAAAPVRATPASFVNCVCAVGRGSVEA